MSTSSLVKSWHKTRTTLSNGLVIETTVWKSCRRSSSRLVFVLVYVIGAMQTNSANVLV